MGITKNRQSEETIRRMVSVAFPEKQVKAVTELTEGLCNAAYLVELSDGQKSVLKIASGSGKGLMSNEVNMMKAEVRAMKLVKKNSHVKVAKVQYYDSSMTLCDGEYFFMEALEGNSFFSIKDKLTEEEQNAIHYEIGQTEKEISGIRGEKFGLLGDNEHQYDNLFDFIFCLIKNVLTDAAKKSVVIGVEPEEILACLTKDRALFDMVKQPVLVHWDMWEGNIFIKEKHISGIIDWERALWGEPFMDDRFRRHTRNEAFLRGFGQEVLGEEEMRRIYWYDVFLYLTMMTEGAYREYEDDGQYRWVKPLFEASYQELRRQQKEPGER